MTSLKSEVHKLDIDKLTPVPVDLSKLSDVVKNDIVRKAGYDKLVDKINNTDNCRFLKKNKCDTDKAELENKISGTSVLS